MPLTARYLATVAPYSEQHFHRAFKRVIGESVNVYIRRTRLEHAANQLMLDHQSSVLEIAEKCGFMSLSSCNKVFKEYLGETPGQWRHRHSRQGLKRVLDDHEITAG